jgi:hypothetical protein
MARMDRDLSHVTASVELKSAELADKVKSRR